MDGQPARTLVVLRHAKAAHDPALADEDRPLTRRGRRDAAAAGTWLRQAGLMPGLVLCSPARRARQTWAEVTATLGGPSPEQVSFEPGLYYGGTVPRLLGLIQQTPDEVLSLMLVGHNPGLHQLVVDLTGEGGLGFPTAALAVLELPGGWLDVTPGAGALARGWNPKLADGR